MSKKEISITAEGKGLTKHQIDEVLKTLREARKREELPALEYEFNPHPLLGKDPIYITPKTASIESTATKIRLILHQEFNNKYTVKLS